ncbi:hypothetical protein BKI52_14370 [marine bacterium AO1-C]|nr:hypothetical protein BKI52_14370 [marine bacterium AO1-C]
MAYIPAEKLTPNKTYKQAYTTHNKRVTKVLKQVFKKGKDWKIYLSWKKEGRDKKKNQVLKSTVYIGFIRIVLPLLELSRANVSSAN